MAIAKDNSRIGLVVNKTIKSELQYLADKDDRTLSNYIVRILTDHVEQQRKLGKLPEKIEQNDFDSDNS